MKSKYLLGCTGHINLSRIENFNEIAVREKLQAYLEALCKDFDAELYCGLAYGADSLFAEVAIDCGVKVFAVLPCSAKEFAAEQPDGGKLFYNLIKKVEGIIIAEDLKDRYVGISKYMVDKCDALLAIWDGKKLPLTDADGKSINRGGTYHTILLAQSAGKSVYVFN